MTGNCGCWAVDQPDLRLHVAGLASSPPSGFSFTPAFGPCFCCLNAPRPCLLACHFLWVFVHSPAVTTACNDPRHLPRRLPAPTAPLFFRLALTARMTAVARHTCPPPPPAISPSTRTPVRPSKQLLFASSSIDVISETERANGAYTPACRARCSEIASGPPDANFAHRPKSTPVRSPRSDSDTSRQPGQLG